MRLSQTLALVGFVVGNALASCPYAEQLASRSDIRAKPDSHKSTVSKRAEGKKGVFYMSVCLNLLPLSIVLRQQQITSPRLNVYNMALGLFGDTISSLRDPCHISFDSNLIMLIMT